MLCPDIILFVDKDECTDDTSFRFLNEMNCNISSEVLASKLALSSLDNDLK